MMRNIFKTLFFIILIAGASCTKENNQLGNGKVNVTSIGYKFNEVATKSNKNTEERVIGSSALELDDKYILIGELVETNEDIITNTKLPYSYEPVTAVQVLTFYKQDAKTENRLQNLNMTDKTFELPPEGGCDVVFLGNVRGTSPAINIDNTKDEATVTSVNTGTNLCYFIKSYGNSIPATENLSNMTPLFAQIGEIVVPTSTTDNWSISAINNLTITSGCQETSGNIVINKGSVSYTKLNTNNPVSIGTFTSNTTTAKNLNVIPNGNKFVINADIKLSNKTNSVNLSFDFNQPIVSGKRYMLNFTIRRTNGITVLYHVNTQQSGYYNNDYDKYKQVKLNYGDAIKLPANNPERVATEYFDPTQVMTFEGWYKQRECNKADKISTNLPLTVENFPELKGTDIISIYAYFEPHFYYWNSDKTISKGGSPVQNGRTFTNSMASDPEFKKLPKGDEFKKYANAPKFYDNGYTKDNQQGYWFLKWDLGTAKKGSKDYDPISTIYCNDIYKQDLIEITNGKFPSGYDISDYFFVPILGLYNSEDLTKCSTIDPGDAYCWPCDFYNDRNYIIYDGLYETLAKAIYYSEVGLYLFEKDGIYNEGRSVPRDGLLRYWPDPTYPGN